MQRERVPSEHLQKRRPSSHVGYRVRTLRPRAKPIQGEPIELRGGPGDGLLLFVDPPLPRTLEYPCPDADHRYQLQRDLTGWRYLYRGSEGEP